MAKALTKSAIMKDLADKTCLKKKEVAAVIEALVAMAYKEARNTFVVPGLGKLVLVQRPAREVVMRFGPKAGQTVKVPPKKVVKFRISKAAKDAILK